MERLTYGVVLTAGSQIKKSPVFDNQDERFVDEDGEFIYRHRSRIEPDLEGKMRLISALEDLENGRIEKILIAGGARNFNRPLASIYLEWLNRYVEMGRISPGSVEEVKGGVNTETDLEKTTKMLKSKKFEGEIILYSSGYHFERRSISRYKKRFKMGQVVTQASETKIQERHRNYRRQSKDRSGENRPPLPWRILSPRHLEAMRARNRMMDKIPQPILDFGAYLLRR